MSAAQTRVEQTRQVARDRQRRALTLKRAAIAQRAETRRVAQAQAELQSRRNWVSPITGAVFTSGFGYRWGRMHQSDDLVAPVGTPLLAMSEGVVISAGYEGGYGNKVEIRYWDGTVSVYAHMDSIDVAEGQQVGSGARVGASGNTGRSTGPHLHKTGAGSAVRLDKFPQVARRTVHEAQHQHRRRLCGAGAGRRTGCPIRWTVSTRRGQGGNGARDAVWPGSAAAG